jgi:hypothetical protein
MHGQVTDGMQATCKLQSHMRTVSIHMYTSRNRYATMYDRMTNTTKIFVQYRAVSATCHAHRDLMSTSNARRCLVSSVHCAVPATSAEHAMYWTGARSCSDKCRRHWGTTCTTGGTAPRR